MTFKTWEKIYWVIIGFFFLLGCSPLLGSGEVEVRVQNKPPQMVSKLTYFGYLSLGFVIIFVPIWVIIRLIVNGGWEDKKKKN